MVEEAAATSGWLVEANAAAAGEAEAEAVVFSSECLELWEFELELFKEGDRLLLRKAKLLGRMLRASSSRLASLEAVEELLLLLVVVVVMLEVLRILAICSLLECLDSEADSATAATCCC